jgi:hypothetical protein
MCPTDKGPNEGAAGHTHVYTKDGHQHMVQDGHVTVPEENVAGFVSAGFREADP